MILYLSIGQCLYGNASDSVGIHEWIGRGREGGRKREGVYGESNETRDEANASYFDRV